MDMRDKKGWLRLVEVTLAIVLMIGAVFIFYQERTFDVQNSVEMGAYQSIDASLKNQNIRNDIFLAASADDIRATEKELNNSISTELNRPDVELESEICLPAANCVAETPTQETGKCMQ